MFHIICDDVDRVGRSQHEVDEFLAIGIALSAQNVHEDENEDVPHNVSWVLDQFVADEQHHSYILEAVAG